MAEQHVPSVLDLATLQRLFTQTQEAAALVPANPAGLKQFLEQWPLPLLAQMVDMLAQLNTQVAYNAVGLQQIHGQVAAINAQEGVVAIAESLLSLEAMTALNPQDWDHDIIRSTIAVALLTAQDKFGLGFDFEGDDEDDSDEDDSVDDGGPTQTAAPAPAHAAAVTPAAPAPTPAAPTPAPSTDATIRI